MSNSTILEKCCLIGQPVGGNPTHYMIEQALRQAGVDWRFMTFEVAPAALEDAFRGIRALGIRGVKVADPHCAAAMALIDEASELAQRCGSVNCVTRVGDRLVGDNTEGEALVQLVRACQDPAGKHAVVLGAGRLARAVGVALAQAGVASLTIVNRDAERGEALVAALVGIGNTSAQSLPWPAVPLVLSPDTTLLINATSLSDGNPDKRLPIDPASFDKRLVAADTSIWSSRPWLLRQAAERGCRTIDGLSLLVEQTALAVTRWSGETVDKNVMREAAEEYLSL